MTTDITLYRGRCFGNYQRKDAVMQFFEQMNEKREPQMRVIKNVSNQ